jgi:hypothetical protein
MSATFARAHGRGLLHEVAELNNHDDTNKDSGTYMPMKRYRYAKA